MSHPLRVNYFGMLRSCASWARVNRELILALDRAGYDVSATHCKGFLYDPGFPLDSRLIDLLEKPRHTDVEIAFEYPLNYPKLIGDVKIALLVYETSPLPAHWVEAILEFVDHLVVPSRFCRRIMTASGIPSERVSVAPYGVNPSIFHPGTQAPSPGRFTFLCVATPHVRKGIVDLLDAYGQAFTSADHVQLILKSTYEPGKYGRLRPWETRPFSELAARARQRHAYYPPVTVIVEQSTEEELVRLYGACDCYVQPSYSEGFGLSILEAMACGKPVVTTGWGGQMDFCTEGNAYLVQYDLVPAGPAQYDNRAEAAVVARPRVNDLAEAMRRVYQHRDEAARKATDGLRTAQRLSWDHSALSLMDIVKRQMCMT